jgi:transmembrane sensor
MSGQRDDAAPRRSAEETIEATAAAWLAQRDDGLSQVEAAEFAKWRAADRRHDAAVLRLEKTWSVLQQLRDFRPETQFHPDRNLLSRQTKRQRVRAFPSLTLTALAASIAFTALAWTTIRTKRAATELPSHYATTIDGYERVMLADGSVLELNSASEVSVQFTPATRHVRLVRGEVHFTVAKNPARPFTVEAGAVAVRAVGTAFNVRFGGRDIEVLVTEGKVSVADAAPANRGTAPVPAPDTVLAAHERIVIPVRSALPAPAPVVEQVTATAVRQALAWQVPRLVFVDTPLTEVIAQFNRRNVLQLNLADDQLGALPISGSFRAENVEAFVRLLTSGGEIVAEPQAEGSLVLRKAN